MRATFLGLAMAAAIGALAAIAVGCSDDGSCTVCPCSSGDDTGAAINWDAPVDISLSVEAPWPYEHSGLAIHVGGDTLKTKPFRTPGGIGHQGRFYEGETLSLTVLRKDTATANLGMKPFFMQWRWSIPGDLPDPLGDIVRIKMFLADSLTPDSVWVDYR